MEFAGVALADGVDGVFDEVIDLLDAAADVEHGVEGAVEVGVGEGAVGFEAGKEVVGFAFLLDLIGGELGVAADAFVEVLAVAAAADGDHEDIFGGHEGEFGFDALLDDGVVDDESAGGVDEDVEDGVGGEEGFGDDDALVGGVVESAFEDLFGGGLEGITDEVHEETGEAGDALGEDGVAFVGHGAGADLLFFEGLVDLFEGGEHADVECHFVGGGGECCEGGDDLGIDDTGVGLAGDGVNACEAEAFRDGELEFFDFFVIAFEELEEGGLGTGGAFDSAQHEGLEAELDVSEDQDEIVGPEDGAFADGGGLCGLKMGVGEARKVAVFGGEGSERVDEVGDFLSEDGEGVAGEEDVGVVDDVHRGGAEMEDGFGAGGSDGEGVEMRHEIVAYA